MRALGDSSNKTTRARASKRSRTGCITCKIRRVKCDETRPECKRCTSTGRTCDGYPSAGVPSQHSSRRALATAVRQLQVVGPAARVLGKPLAVDDVGCFDFFRICTASMTGSVYPGEKFWSVQMLQVAHVEPAVWKAAVALGALHRRWEFMNYSFSPNFTRRPGPARDTTDMLLFTNQALKHYADSLSLAKSISDPRLLAVLSVALGAAAHLAGRWADSQVHIKAGLRLLRELQESAPTATAGRPAPLPSDLEGVAQALERLDAQAMSLSDATSPYKYAKSSLKESKTLLHMEQVDKDPKAKETPIALLGSMDDLGQAALAIFRLMRQFFIIADAVTTGRISPREFEHARQQMVEAITIWEKQYAMLVTVAESKYKFASEREVPRRPEQRVLILSLTLYHTTVELFLLAHGPIILSPKVPVWRPPINSQDDEEEEEEEIPDISEGQEQAPAETSRPPDMEQVNRLVKALSSCDGKNPAHRDNCIGRLFLKQPLAVPGAISNADAARIIPMQGTDPGRPDAVCFNHGPLADRRPNISTTTTTTTNNNSKEAETNTRDGGIGSMNWIGGYPPHPSWLKNAAGHAEPPPPSTTTTTNNETRNFSEGDDQLPPGFCANPGYWTAFMRSQSTTAPSNLSTSPSLDSNNSPSPAPEPPSVQQEQQQQQEEEPQPEIPTTETRWDALHGHFQRIVSLASEIAQNTESPLPFFMSLEPGLAMPLYLVVKRCRHPITRRRALGLLRRLNRQEGIWNCALAARAAEEVILLEEEESFSALSSESFSSLRVDLQGPHNIEGIGGGLRITDEKGSSTTPGDDQNSKRDGLLLPLDYFEKEDYPESSNPLILEEYRRLAVEKARRAVWQTHIMSNIGNEEEEGTRRGGSEPEGVAGNKDPDAELFKPFWEDGWPNIPEEKRILVQYPIFQLEKNQLVLLMFARGSSAVSGGGGGGGGGAGSGAKVARQVVVDMF